jgi:hypothetical protein
MRRQNNGQAKEQGVTHSIFGDILGRFAQVPEDKLAEIELSGCFSVMESANERFDADHRLALKQSLFCVMKGFSTLCRVIDEAFINDLPENVDVCENGEFHTLLLMGPFSKPTLKLAKWFTGSTKDQKRRFSDTACDSSASDIFDYGFGIVI